MEALVIITDGNFVNPGATAKSIAKKVLEENLIKNGINVKCGFYNNNDIADLLVTNCKEIAESSKKAKLEDFLNELLKKIGSPCLIKEPQYISKLCTYMMNNPEWVKLNIKAFKVLLTPDVNQRVILKNYGFDKVTSWQNEIKAVFRILGHVEI